jgi:hypothetical protein
MNSWKHLYSRTFWLKQQSAWTADRTLFIVVIYVYCRNKANAIVINFNKSIKIAESEYNKNSKLVKKSDLNKINEKVKINCA